MIKEIKARYWRWKNIRWLNAHKRELDEKYSYSFILIDRCKEVSASKRYSDLPWDTYDQKDGCICYRTPINWKIEDKSITTHIFSTG